jgi:hypothetical protein
MEGRTMADTDQSSFKRGLSAFFGRRDVPGQAPPLPAKLELDGMRITFSLPVAVYAWLDWYAAQMREPCAAIAEVAIAHAKRASEPFTYVEPGTSVTQKGVAEIELALPTRDAQWILQRAAADRVSHCAVFHAVLTHYQPIAPASTHGPGRTTVAGQRLFYMQIASHCEQVAEGMPPDEADENLGQLVAIRLFRLLPEIDRKILQPAVIAAIRELCVNHPVLRQAHGRDDTSGPP